MKCRIMQELTVASIKKSRLFGLLAQEGNEIISVLRLLQATESHLCAGNVLLWVL
jgi:hypothetical protein